MKKITSTANNLIIDTNKLKQKKFRDESGLYFIEGKRIVFEAVKRRAKLINVFILEELYESFKDLIAGYEELVVLTDKKVQDFLSDTENNQGILAVVEKNGQCSLSDEKLTVEDKFLLLDNISDPANLGTVTRTAHACGYKTIFMNNCTDAYNPKAVRGGMGALFSLNIIEAGLERIVSFLRQNKIFIITASVKGENVFEFLKRKDAKALLKKHCLVIGSEAFGASALIESASDKILKLPMQDDAESLNASVSAGIFMYLLAGNGSIAVKNKS